MLKDRNTTSPLKIQESPQKSLVDIELKGKSSLEVSESCDKENIPTQDPRILRMLVANSAAITCSTQNIEKTIPSLKDNPGIKEAFKEHLKSHNGLFIPMSLPNTNPSHVLDPRISGNNIDVIIDSAFAES